MPNLIIEAVPPSQTGEATGFNALVRSVGASVGTQVTATILTGEHRRGRRAAVELRLHRSRSSSRPPSRRWRRWPRVAIPRASLQPHAHASALDEMGAASPLGDPALASEGRQ